MASSSNVTSSYPTTGVALCLAALVGATVATSAPARAADPWPDRVEATYRIAFNGFDVGKFHFSSSVDGNVYTASGDARMSALLGAFKWRGASRSSGALRGFSAEPQGYTFDYNGSGKAGAVKLGFNKGTVNSIAVLPAKPPSPGSVPVREAHLQNVLDPLSAVLALSRSRDPNPCGRRIGIFDGKQRFDLVLSYVRQQRIAEARPSGQPGVGFVCRVRYVPIAGHRMNRETRNMAANEGIEVAFRPVPSAGLFVPYQISIPTPAGTATLTSERINIVTRREQIALIN